MDIIYYRLRNEMRWDQLAYLGYGDAGRAADLLAANKDIGVFNWVPAGVVIQFPVILDAALNPLTSQLPEWKK